MTQLPPLVRDTEFLPIPRLRSGKVREIYDLGELLLIVATDRISAFDVVFPKGVPGKGIILTQMAAFWFELLGERFRHHLVSTDTADLPASVRPYADRLRGRFMLVRKVEIFPVECIVRGYLAGSGWKAYRQSGEVCDHALPPGLEQAQRLPEAIFTPSTKADTGHDEHITEAEAASIIGADTYQTAKDASLDLYAFARDYLDERGIIMADTKFEFGLRDGEVTLADEILTPDSSRFWPKADYRVGISPPSLDKQYLRDYLETLDWDKTPPAPELPGEVVENLLNKYHDIYRIITSRSDAFAGV